MSRSPVETAPVLTGIFALASVVVGGFLTQNAQLNLWRRQEALDASMLAADTHELIWGEESHAGLVIHLGKLRGRLGALGLGSAVISEVEETALARCGEAYGNSYHHPDGDPWLRPEILNDFRAAQRAVWDAVRPGRWRTRRRA